MPPTRTGTKLLRVVEFIVLAVFLACGCLFFVHEEAPVTGSQWALAVSKMLFAPFSAITFNIISLYRAELAKWLHRVQKRYRGQYMLVQNGTQTH